MPNPLQQKAGVLTKILEQKWLQEYTQSPYLKSLKISSSGNGLRGISNAHLDINFPLTVVAGANGSGKTTIAQLAILAFHAEQKPKTSAKAEKYFKFNHFFQYTSNEKPSKDIKVTFEYTTAYNRLKNKEKIVNKTNERWMRYIGRESPTRPKRGTEFIGISRIVPQFEKKGAEKKLRLVQSKKQSYSPQLEGYLKEIFCRAYTYQYAEKNDRSGHYTLNDYGDYTSFNCGAGEEAVTNILSVLLSSPEGSIIAIEEIEIGIHPACLKPLVRVLLEIINQRKLQVFVTSHSPHFLRCCPKQSLIWLKRIGNECKFIDNPNVEMIVNDLGVKPQKTLWIFCEDDVAATFIQKTIKKREELNLIQIIGGLGGWNSLYSHACKYENIFKVPKKKILLLYDGELNGKPQDKEKAIKYAQDNGFEYEFLPSKFTPEGYIKDKIENDKTILQELFDYEGAIDFSALSDNHDIFAYISQAVDNTTADEAVQDARDKIIEKICQKYPDDFVELKKKIQEMINK